MSRCRAFSFVRSSRTSVRLGAWFWSAKLTYSYQNHCASSRSVYLSRRLDSHWDKFATTHHLKDAAEKVLILRKVAQDKVYLYVLRYYILYAKTVFQWRLWRGGSLLDWDKINRIRSAKCFLRTLTEKVAIIYRRNRNEKKQKMCANLENTWFLDCTGKSTKK